MLLLRSYLSLPVLTLLSLSGCFSVTDQLIGKTPPTALAHPFSKPQATAFAGEYRLTEQHFVNDLVAKRFESSRLVLKPDLTFRFTAYPRLVDRPGSGWTLDSVTALAGTWHLAQTGSAFNAAKQAREEFWSCQFVPSPPPADRLTVSPYIDHKTGHLAQLYFYLGDPDSGAYLLYELAKATP